MNKLSIRIISNLLNLWMLNVIIYDFQEDMFETSSVISMSGGRSIGGASAAIQLEALQASLKQKQGTIIQQQMEVSDLERTKEGE